MQSLDWGANLALISASTSLIIVSIITALTPELSGKLKTIIDTGQNCIPVVMLALSIMVSGARYGARSERMHDCAQELNHFRKLINFKIKHQQSKANSKKFSKDAEKYARIISKCENHSTIDKLVESLNNWAKGKCLYAFYTTLASILSKGILFYLYLSVTALSLAWIITSLFFAFKGM